MAGMKLDILADTTSAQREVTDLSGALDKVGDSLDDVVKDSAQGTERIERDFRELAKSAEKAGRESRAGLSDNFKRSAKESTDSLDKIKEGTKELKNEAIANFSETASSFDGSLQSIADAAQGTLGGVALGLSTLGPAGIAAGTALGVGGAIVGTVFSQMADDAEASAERIGTAFDDLIASGNAWVSEEVIQANLKAILLDDGKLAKAKKDAQELGVTIREVLRAQAGDQEAIGTLIGKGNDLRASEIQKIKDGSDILQDQVTQIEVVNDKWNQVLDTYTNLNGEAQKSLERANLYLQAIDEASAAEQRRLQIVRDKIEGMPKSIPVALELDTAAFDRRVNDYKSKRITVRADIVDRYGRDLP